MSGNTLSRIKGLRSHGIWVWCDLTENEMEDAHASIPNVSIRLHCLVATPSSRQTGLTEFFGPSCSGWVPLSERISDHPGHVEPWELRKTHCYLWRGAVSRHGQG